MTTDVKQTIANYFTKFPLRKYSAGQILLYADEKPEKIYYIVKGNIRQYDISYRGDQLVVNIFRPGAFFPINHVIADTPSKFFYECETEVEAHIIPPEDAKEFLLTNQDVLYDLLARVYRGMDGILGRMLHLMSGSAKGRVLYELIIECRRSGEPRDDGSYFIALHEKDIAARAGLSRETVSREIQKIGHDGLIGVDQQGITVKSLEQLELRLGSEV